MILMVSDLFRCKSHMCSCNKAKGDVSTCSFMCNKAEGDVSTCFFMCNKAEGDVSTCVSIDNIINKFA